MTAVSTTSALIARPAVGHLSLRNESETPVHYVALEERTAALVDLYFDPSLWPSVPPKTEVQLPLEEVMGYTRDSKRVFLYWWTGQSGTQHFQVDLR